MSIKEFATIVYSMNVCSRPANGCMQASPTCTQQQMYTHISEHEMSLSSNTAMYHTYRHW